MIAGKKTYLTALVAVGYALFAYLHHDIDLAAAVQLAETAAVGAFLRHGLSTGA